MAINIFFTIFIVIKKKSTRYSLGVPVHPFHLVHPNEIIKKHRLVSKSLTIIHLGCK